MGKLIAELCDILELADLPLNVPFEDLPEWDSLNALSVIALLESNLLCIWMLWGRKSSTALMS